MAYVPSVPVSVATRIKPTTVLNDLTNINVTAPEPCKRETRKPKTVANVKVWNSAESEALHQWPSIRRSSNGKRLTQTSRGSGGASFGLSF
jgi:hypothetical protein